MLYDSMIVVIIDCLEMEYLVVVMVTPFRDFGIERQVVVLAEIYLPISCTLVLFNDTVTATKLRSLRGIDENR